MIELPDVEQVLRRHLDACTPCPNGCAATLGFAVNSGGPNSGQAVYCPGCRREGVAHHMPQMAVFLWNRGDVFAREARR